MPTGPEITGPFTGITRRFMVDRVTLPDTKEDFADDLDGDGNPDNVLARTIALIQTQHAGVTSISDLIASGVLASSVEVTSDDIALRDDATVGIRFFGTSGDAADVMGASLSGGHLVSNRLRVIRKPAFSVIRLPFLAGADPTVFPSAAVEVELSADGSGFSGVIHGIIRSELIPMRVFDSLVQGIEDNPVARSSLAHLVDTNGDGHLTLDEFLQAPLFKGVLAPDLEMFAGDGSWCPAPRGTEKNAMSFGFGIHLTPCEAGDCALAVPSNHCDDRIRDADETDIDCGGSCGPCAGGRACSDSGGCQTTLCSGGYCAPASCSDGILDGFESDIDCGDGCAPCADGRKCISRIDCASGACCIVAGTCAPSGTDPTSC